MINDIIYNGLTQSFISGTTGGFLLVLIIELFIFGIKKAWYLFKNIIH